MRGSVMVREWRTGERVEQAAWWRWTRRVLTGVCGAVLAGAAGLAVVRLAGWDDGTSLALVVVGVPYAALASVLALGVLLALRSWWPAALAGALVAVQLVWLVPRLVPEGGGTPAADAPRLRVATSNAYLGQADAAALVRLVREQRVDVLAMEEFGPGAAERLDRAGIAEVLPHREQRPGRDTAIFSRLPLTPLDGSASEAAREQIAAEVAVGGRTVRLTAVHTYYPMGDAGRWAEDFDELRAAVAGATRNAVLLGDFNATLDHSPMRALLGTGLTDTHEELGRGVAPTWPESNTYFPGLWPVIQIDHVLHGEALRAVSVTEHTVRGSDHRAVVAELAVTG
ncbi:endonuclease/exonuclease/phosphatase family protein [Kitasatospora sp. NPDC008115]|uniref:endonuclease/exonuclease/phosphatase family protein n=1 Tax=Kitasatospora sp. NPDC008115 TaxID=3364022 RepID=UPI0036EEC496